jgi:hypothetical protein
MTTTLTTAVGRQAAREATGLFALARTSDLLKNILATNPGVETFTIGSIVDAMGPGQVEASLMLFSVPGVIPVPDAPSFSNVGAATLGLHLALGRKRLVLPKALLRKKVPRRSLAVAIHLLLPVLERAERNVRPRLTWVNHPISKGILGILVFLLAVTIAFPLVGFDQLHALSIFIISLGLVERDGLAVLVGVIAGIASLALVTTIGLTGRILRSRLTRWLRKIGRRLGRHALAVFFERRGWKWLAEVFRSEWQQSLLLWDPEKAEIERRWHQLPEATKTTAARRDNVTRRGRHTHQAVSPKLPKKTISQRSVR